MMMLQSLFVLQAVAREEQSLLQAVHKLQNSFTVTETSDQSADQRADALAEVEESVMKMSAVPGSHSTDLSSIKTLLDTFDKTIKAEHATDQKSLTDAITSGTTCNTQFDSNKQTNDDAKKLSSDGLADTHTSCRGQQADLLIAQTSAQTGLNGFIAGLQQPDCKVPQRAGLADGSWFASIQNFVNTNQAAHAGKEKAATDAESGYSIKKGSCDTAQTSYESAFCLWRLEVHTSCGIHDLCFDGAQKIYDKAVADSAARQSVRHQEFKTIAKIRCHVDNLSSGTEKSCADADVSDQTLAAGTMPTKTACNQVTDYPGETGFSYSVAETKAVTKCGELSEWSHKATTPAPTTAAPTAAMGERTLVLQYGTTAYTPSKDAVGTVGAGTGFAKLSDADINSIQDFDSAYDYFQFTSDKFSSSDTGRVFVRTPQGSFDDPSRNMGWTSYSFCWPQNAVSIDECTWRGASCGSRFDTQCLGSYGYDDRRWFMDYSGPHQCYNPASSTQRCMNGNYGGHVSRKNVKLYKISHR